MLLDKTPKQKCRCYINAKYYARQASIGGNMKGYVPCPIHELDQEKHDTKNNRSK